MSTNNIMIALDNFFNEKGSIKLFNSLGKTIKVEDGWISMYNNKRRKKEDLFVWQDADIPASRIRLKGKDTAISLRKGEEGIMVDHILLGEIDKENFHFSMRKSIDNDDICYCIKSKEDKNRYVYWFKKDKINLSCYDDSKEDGGKHYFYTSSKNNIKTEYDKEECKKALRHLEGNYSTITGLIGDEIPLVKTFIDSCYKKEEAMMQTKIYQMKSKNEKRR